MFNLGEIEKLPASQEVVDALLRALAESYTVNENLLRDVSEARAVGRHYSRLLDDANGQLRRIAALLPKSPTSSGCLSHSVKLFVKNPQDFVASTQDCTVIPDGY